MCERVVVVTLLLFVVVVVVLVCLLACLLACLLVALSVALSPLCCSCSCVALVLLLYCCRPSAVTLPHRSFGLYKNSLLFVVVQAFGLPSLSCNVVVVS